VLPGVNTVAFEPHRLLTAGIVVAAAVALGIGGCGGSNHHPRPAALLGSGTTTTTAITAPHPAAPRRPPTPAQRHLDAALARILHEAGPASGALVYDLTADRTLFAWRAAIRRPPASVEKIYTSLALVQELGPGARLHTSVLGTGHLGPQGTWHGNLYLRGGGDPTFGDGAFNQTWEMGYGPTALQLVHQLERRGIRRVTGRVIGDESLFDSRRGGPATGFAPDVPDFGGQLSALTYDHGSTSGRLSPAAFAARQLVRVMRGAHISATAASHTAAARRSAKTLASVSSPPVSVLLKLMDVPSDDLFAELLTKQLGVLYGAGGTIAAGSRVIAEVIATYALHPRIVDGSGLSRADRSSPREVVELLRAVWRTPAGRQLAAALPTVGVDGTVRSIGVGTLAQARCIAKTGTLDYVTNLAGYCRSRRRHTLAFAVFIDGPPNAQATVLDSRLVGAIAWY
jgi:D-alanyl-D-alanine carboxypeptidase/D-alanyl-D-alanine-endopeptidase (penicillin-binding protein 4)